MKRDYQKIIVLNFPGGTTETILEEVEELVKNKPDTLIVQTGTSDLTKGRNVVNNVKEIIKSVKSFSPETKLVFSSLIVRQDDIKDARATSMTLFWCL